jgi:hypothetical protein
MENEMTKRASALGVRVDVDGTNTGKDNKRLATRLRTAVRIARTTGPMLRRRSSPAVAATRTSLRWATRTVRAMPSSPRRSLAAGSLGFGAGLYMGGAPRLIAATGVAPAIVIGAASLMRQDEQVTA